MIWYLALGIALLGLAVGPLADACSPPRRHTIIEVEHRDDDHIAFSIQSDAKEKPKAYNLTLPSFPEVPEPDPHPYVMATWYSGNLTLDSYRLQYEVDDNCCLCSGPDTTAALLDESGRALKSWQAKVLYVTNDTAVLTFDDHVVAIPRQNPTAWVEYPTPGPFDVLYLPRLDQLLLWSPEYGFVMLLAPDGALLDRYAGEPWLAAYDFYFSGPLLLVGQNVTALTIREDGFQVRRGPQFDVAPDLMLGMTDRYAFVRSGNQVLAVSSMSVRTLVELDEGEKWDIGSGPSAYQDLGIVFAVQDGDVSRVWTITSQLRVEQLYPAKSAEASSPTLFLLLLGALAAARLRR